jgi:hypothetical protein
VNCKIDDCDGTVRARGWCSKHYTRWHRHGDPLVVKATQERPACGTYGGYQAHKRRNEPACDSCNAANNEYHTQHRAANGAAKQRERRRNAVHGKAVWRLAREYPKRFAELVEQYKAEVGT